MRFINSIDGNIFYLIEPNDVDIAAQASNPRDQPATKNRPCRQRSRRSCNCNQQQRQRAKTGTDNGMRAERTAKKPAATPTGFFKGCSGSFKPDEEADTGELVMSIKLVSIWISELYVRMCHKSVDTHYKFQAARTLAIHEKPFTL